MTIVGWAILMLFAGMAAVIFLELGNMQLIADLNRRIGPDRGPLVPSGGLKIDARAPEFAATDARTQARVSLELYGRSAGLMVFLSPNCRTCIELVDPLNTYARSYKNVPITVVVKGGTGRSGNSDYERLLDKRISLVAGNTRRICDAYGVDWTPWVYAIQSDRKISLKIHPRDRIDLEDLLDGFGHPQTQEWVRAEPASPDESPAKDDS